MAALKATPPGRRALRFFGALVFQVIYVTPVYWFLELIQNRIYWSLIGEPGWYYPRSPYYWFSFESLGLWAGSVVVIATLHYFWFHPQGVRTINRVIFAGTICWALEWTSGYVADRVMSHPLHVWTGTSLVYVKISAMFFWWWDVLLYQLLTVNVVNLKHLAEERKASKRPASPPEPSA